MNWTKNDIEKLKLTNNLSDLPRNSVLNDIKKQVKTKISVEKETVSKILWVYKRDGLIDDYVEELQFDDVRKWRFDWAIPSLKLAIEYEGLFSKKSGHTTVKGYTKDCQKYNKAQLNGWTVLRYTALNYKNFENDLKAVLNM